jgi:hypothetical protein
MPVIPDQRPFMGGEPERLRFYPDWKARGLRPGLCLEITGPETDGGTGA